MTKLITYPDNIDLSDFKKDKSSVTKYGLPADVKFCTSCVMTNQLPKKVSKTAPFLLIALSLLKPAGKCAYESTS